jgi:hypothetical protein
MYSYECKKWFRNVKGIRNYYIDENNDKDIKLIENYVLEDIESNTNSKHCKIEILQKFNITIKPLEMYASMVKFPSSINYLHDKNDINK